MNMQALRDAVAEVANEIGGEHGARLHEIIATMSYRANYRGGDRSKRVRAKSVTDEMRRSMARMAAANPLMPYRDIGAAHGVDGGRVSEAVARAKQEGWYHA
jgi:hypothetical protein